MHLRRFIFSAGILGYLFATGISQAISTSVLDTETIAAITPTEVQYPAGAAGYYYPILYVRGNQTVTGNYLPQSRIVMEFALATITPLGAITTAILDITTLGGTRGLNGALEYRLFGYAGTGLLNLDSGAAGQELAGPYFYDIDFGSNNPQLNDIDVTPFVRSVAESGATHVGFSLRDTNTPPGALPDSQAIVVQDSPYWAGDVPPTLTVTTKPSTHSVPDTGSTLSLLAASLLTLFTAGFFRDKRLAS